MLSASIVIPIRHVFADQGFSGRLLDRARDTLRTTLEIVRKPADQRGFAVHPHRWVGEPHSGLAHRLPPLARDHERHPAVSEATIRWAATAGMTRRITRGHPRPPTAPSNVHLDLMVHHLDL